MLQIPVYGVRLIVERTLTVDLQQVRSARDVYTLVAAYLVDVDREHFGVLLLDTQHQIRGVETVTIGILDASLVAGREVFKSAILASAASIILFHNHPSGDPTPSAEDRAITRMLKSGGELLGIDLIDHVVVGDGRYVSFAEAGLL